MENIIKISEEIAEIRIEKIETINKSDLISRKERLEQQLALITERLKVFN